jgi:hypothetical protein
MDFTDLTDQSPGLYLTQTQQQSLGVGGLACRYALGGISAERLKQAFVAAHRAGSVPIRPRR